MSAIKALASGPMDMPELRARAVSLLKEYLRAPVESRTRIIRELGETLIETRAQFERPDGSPDWTGRTHAYRRAIREMYDDAGIGERDRAQIQGAVRFHIANILRERLTEEQLAEYSLLPRGPHDRDRDNRSTKSAIVAAVSAREVHGGALLALSAAYSLLSKLDLDDLDALSQREAGVADSTIADIERRARQLRRRLAANDSAD